MSMPYAYGLLFALWVFFLAVMSLKRARAAGTLRGVALVLGLQVLAIGYVLDFAGNLLLSLVFLEQPHEMTVSARVERHELGPPGWCRSAAVFICKYLLNPFDPRGYHCNPL